MASIEAFYDLNFLSQTFLNLVKLLTEIIVIVIPLMMFMEVLKDLNILERISGWFTWLVRPFGLPVQAIFPLLVGLVFGIAYGGSLIIDSAKEGTLSKRDLYLINLFLVINHSIIEDTLLFVAIGAKGFVLIIFRFITSFLITWLVGTYFIRANSHQLEINQPSKIE